MNIFSIIIFSTLYIYGFILLYITYLARKNNEKGAFVNNFANGLVLITSITVNLILTKILNLVHKEFLVFPFNILMIGFIGLYLPLFYLFISREKHRIRNKNKNIENSKLKPHTELPLKYDIYRKLTHLVVLGIVLIFLGSLFSIPELYSLGFIIFALGVVVIIIQWIASGGMIELLNWLPIILIFTIVSALSSDLVSQSAATQTFTWPLITIILVVIVFFIFLFVPSRYADYQETSHLTPL